MLNDWLMLTVLPPLLLVKWMVVGRDGLAGQYVTRLAEVVNNSELVVATVQPLLIAEILVLGPKRKTVHVMTSPVQVKKPAFPDFIASV